MVFAFAASVSFLLVNVVDPYSGATASPDFASRSDRFGGADVQAFDVDGEYTIDVTEGGLRRREEARGQGRAGIDLGEQRLGPARRHPRSRARRRRTRQARSPRGAGASTEFDCLVALWSKESGWRVNAYNAGSGAYGIPQALPGARWPPRAPTGRRTPATQIEWGLGYIAGRYGTPCGAWAHSQDVGWY